MPSLSFLLASPLAASGLQMALDQPFFPGKVILWLLFMMSLMSWAVMASKTVSLKRYLEGDRLFTNRLRKSKKPLEIHEKGWSEPMSLRQEVYDSGAKEAAFQLLGTLRSNQPAPEFETLTESQMALLRDALMRGVKSAEARLYIGIPVLQAAAAGAPFLGLLGMVWIMMDSFSKDSVEAVSNGASAGFAVMAIALITATPAIFGQIYLRNQCQNRLRELGDFRLELSRLFERSLSSAWNPEKSKPAPMINPMKTPVASSAKEAPERTTTSANAQIPKGIKNKVFKSVRQDEPMINPIAMQAKGLRQQSS